jgi:hypothetical protein
MIQVRGVRHLIKFRADLFRLVPNIEHTRGPSDIKIGTTVTIRWPASVCTILDSA